ncbi:hypothetical protein [Catellatospora chokoriensis]|uniref:L-amino acid ligase C-terminal domain-containing protein n=1 Tax=Catellatospora chokoriensis TaxID=310353 RepID=A0A8J3JVH8_9ACTN|nr:hypothetical protein [Catellatospora chokoriensis]GIF87637.1 hypothetical protein Cch02nite_10810 [Catellatospora chokoriensis]
MLTAPGPALAAAIRFLSARSGTVRAVTPVTVADVVEVRLPEQGQRLRPVRRSQDRPGYVIVTAAEPVAARARAAELAAHVRIDIDGRG